MTIWLRHDNLWYFVVRWKAEKSFIFFKETRITISFFRISLKVEAKLHKNQFNRFTQFFRVITKVISATSFSRFIRVVFILETTYFVIILKRLICTVTTFFTKSCSLVKIGAKSWFWLSFKNNLGRSSTRNGIDKKTWLDMVSDWKFGTGQFIEKILIKKRFIEMRYIWRQDIWNVIDMPKIHKIGRDL